MRTLPKGSTFSSVWPRSPSAGLDVDSVDAADFSAGVLELAGAGEFLAGLGQLAEFFDQTAQSAQQPAQVERAF